MCSAGSPSSALPRHSARTHRCSLPGVEQTHSHLYIAYVHSRCVFDHQFLCRLIGWLLLLRL
jgi:hypothetical protein